MATTPQQAYEYLNDQITQLQQQLQAVTASSSSSTALSFAVKPPKPSFFNGHTPSAHNWVYEMQNYLVAAGVDLASPKAVQTAVPYLRDAAQTWYRQHQQAEELGATPYLTWAALRTAVLLQFAPVDPQTHARDELLTLTSHEHQDVTGYTEQFNTLVVDLPHMFEGDKIYFFTHGLPSAVRMHVRMHRPSSLSQAMELAAQAGDAVHDSSSGISPPVPLSSASSSATGPPGATSMELDSMRAQHTTADPPVCYFCHRSGHVMSKCRDLEAMRQEFMAKRSYGRRR